MSRRVVWSATALKDLLDVVRFIAADNPRAATRVASRVERAADDLGTLATGRPGRIADTFEKVLPGLPYIIIYEVSAEALTGDVSILRVIHAARRWPTSKG